MIEAIKYFPLKFRHIDERCTPKGPSSGSLRQLKFLIGGSVLKLKAPKHKPGDQKSEKFIVNHVDICTQIFRSIHDVPGTNWEISHFLRRKWGFWGPWFSGKQADLSINISADKYKKKLDQGVSLFHPRFFEGCLIDLLSDYYGRRGKEGAPYYSGPLNWKRIENLPVVAALFDVEPVAKGFSAPSVRCLVFPISSSIIIFASFSFSILKSGNLEARRQKVDVSEMDELASKIINSFEITLSPEAQADLDRVKAECPDMRLTDSFPPLKWPVVKGAEENKNIGNERKVLEFGEK